LKKAAILITAILVLCLCSSFWIDYMQNVKLKNTILKQTIDDQNNEMYKLRQECNRLSKERQAWIMEANRLKRRTCE